MDDELLRRLGQRIRNLRSQRGLSQEEFADVCRVHRTYMGHLERGEKNVSLTSIVRVSAALSITLSELFSGIDGGDETPQATGRKPESSTELDRSRILRELAAAERSIQVAKVIAMPPTARKTDSGKKPRKS